MQQRKNSKNKEEILEIIIQTMNYEKKEEGILTLMIPTKEVKVIDASDSNEYST